MSKMMVKVGDEWVPMAGLKGDTGPLPENGSVRDTSLVTDGVKANVAYLIGNRWTKDAEGEFISVEDSYAVPPVNLSAEGKSTQLTTTGKNLYNYTDHGFWAGSVGQQSKLMGPTSTSYSYFRFSVAEGDVIRVAGIYAGVAEHRLAYKNGIIVDKGFNWPYTVPSDVDEISGYFASPNATNQIVTKNNSDMTYESYSGGKPSPNPDYPQEIVSIDELTLSVLGKNLLDICNDPSNPDKGWFSSGGGTSAVAYDVDAGGYYTASHRGVSFFKNDTESNIVITVTMSAKRREGNSSYAMLTWINGQLPSNGFPTNPNSYGSTYTVFVRTYTILPGKAASLTFYNQAFIEWIQVEISSSGSQYEPYSGNSVTIDLSDTPLRSLPDGTKDELRLTYLRPSDRPGWAWYDREVTRRVGEYYVDGVTGTVFYWGTYEKNVRAFLYRPALHDRATSDKNALMCDKFQAVVWGGSGFNSQSEAWSIAPYNGTYGPFFQIPDTSLNSGTLLNAWFAEHPTTVRYAYDNNHIATETLPEIELPTMQSGVTNIWSDPSTNLSVTYERDRNIVVSNLKAAVADLATS